MYSTRSTGLSVDSDADAVAETLSLDPPGELVNVRDTDPAALRLVLGQRAVVIVVVVWIGSALTLTPGSSSMEQRRSACVCLQQARRSAKLSLSPRRRYLPG